MFGANVDAKAAVYGPRQRSARGEPGARRAGDTITAFSALDRGEIDGVTSRSHRGRRHRIRTPGFRNSPGSSIERREAVAGGPARYIENPRRAKTRPPWASS